MAIDGVVIAACFAALGAAGLRETRCLRHAWREVPLRVHVNGTRGKSTVTRLVWAGLRASGMSVVAKTTGTAARLLLPDGTEQPVRRNGPPNIREQARFLQIARQHRADAAVVECMALNPHLQWISERWMVRSTIGVITNVRTDHEEVMGRTLDDIAASLANTVPRSATLVLGEPDRGQRFSAAARALATRVRFAQEIESEIDPVGELPPWERRNLAIALTVTRLVGVSDAVAIPAMRAAPVEPGAVRTAFFDGNDDGPSCLDISSANDAESLSVLMKAFLEQLKPSADPVLVIYNHRRDRPLRLPRMLDAVEETARHCEVVVTGEHPPLFQWWALRRDRVPLSFTSPGDLHGAIWRRRRRVRAVILCGNTRGLDSRSVFGS